MESSQPPVLYFRDDVVEIHDVWDEFESGELEAIDVENGEYDRVFDSIGGRFLFTVSQVPGPKGGSIRSRLHRIFTSPEQVEAEYVPPTADSRRALESELRRVVAGATKALTLEQLVELARANRGR